MFYVSVYSLCSILYTAGSLNQNIVCFKLLSNTKSAISQI